MITWDFLKTITSNNHCPTMYRKDMIQIVYDMVPRERRFSNISKLMGEKDYLLIDNLYPYDLEDGITHMVLFINPRNKVSDIDVKGLLEGLLPGKTYVYCMNSSRNISLPEIPHYQIFIKNI